MNGVVLYFDSVKLHKTRVAAVEAAIEESQIAIYDLQARAVEDIMNPAGADALLHGSAGSFLPSLAAAGRKRALSL